MQKICVLGLGYMGLPTASLLANAGYDVFGFDIDQKKIDKLNQGICPFDEPGLPESFKAAFQAGNFKATSEIQQADVFIIAVPTPSKNQKADLSYVKAATQSVLEVLEEGNLVILESTVRPKTCTEVVAPILDKSGKNYHLVHCPERAIPGHTMRELVENERIIGGDSKKSCNLAKDIYQKFVKGKIYLTNLTTAECCKLMENTFRDVNIALANEFSLLAEELDIDVKKAIDLANLHPRVNIHSPGPGVGGHCIPIDPWFLTENTKNNQLISLARHTNDEMPTHTVRRLIKKAKNYGLSENDLKVAVLGVAYKENVDDARETPTKYVCDLLEQKSIEFKVTDPYVEDFDFAPENLDDVLIWSNCVLIITNHSDYQELIYPDNIKFVFNTK